MTIEEVRNLIEIMNLMKHSANNDNYFEITDEDVKVLYKYITSLQEENSTLKEFNPDYETRINKAIEILEQYGYGTFDEDLLNILKGEQ